jgi:hypothetical protein
MSTKENPGRFDCYAKLPDNEPYFVLRAQDSEAADIVELWALRAQAAGCNSDKVLDAKNLADEMRNWHSKKKPD